MEKWTSGTGQRLRVHSDKECEGEHCPIHNTYDHHMLDWPMHWREDRRIMERLCKCGVGHPDPDDFTIRNGLDKGVHGCCGCCMLPPKPPLSRIIREGDTGRKCHICGSSRAWAFWPFKSKHCIQPQCENNYIRNVK
jgi:hypothetical protein